LLKPVGFWSYSRRDDEAGDGKLSALRKIVGDAFQSCYGEPVTIWQDTAAMPPGADWANTIEDWISETTFFIPIVTPAFLKSEHCLEEFKAFRRRMITLGRDDLIFPIHYVDVGRIIETETVFGDERVALRRSQWSKFHHLRFDPLSSRKVKVWANDLAEGVIDTTSRPTRRLPVAEGGPLVEAKSPTKIEAHSDLRALDPYAHPIPNSSEGRGPPLESTGSRRTFTKQQHLDPAHGPKRILALDGGGIRGILTLEYLSVIETMIRERFEDPHLLLCDYFDLIGGTSTGSIIAAGLACGMSVADLKAIYVGIGSSVFKTDWWSKFTLKGVLGPKFAAEPLQRALDGTLGADTTLDSDRIRTGLMIMTKRLDTGSPWPLHNSPGARYAKQDGQLRLTQIIRASTAAPTYFEPEEIEISSRDGTVTRGAFVDGGVSPFNDPALQLLMLAALQGHGFRWRTGRDQTLLISVGTGTFQQTVTAQELIGAPAAKQGIMALQSLMEDCDRINRSMLQWLTDCLNPWIIDRAVGDVKLDSQTGPQLATYVRYNAILGQGWLKQQLGLDLAAGKIEQIREMDNPANMAELAQLGQVAAKLQVKQEHFPPAFDLR
jgi:predicted patatin/cPLA2 family phospholipase